MPRALLICNIFALIIVFNVDKCYMYIFDISTRVFFFTCNFVAKPLLYWIYLFTYEANPLPSGCIRLSWDCTIRLGKRIDLRKELPKIPFSSWLIRCNTVSLLYDRTRAFLRRKNFQFATRRKNLYQLTDIIR